MQKEQNIHPIKNWIRYSVFVCIDLFRCTRAVPGVRTKVTTRTRVSEKLVATSPLKEYQLKMIKQISSKQQWSNRVEIKIIRLARAISDLEGSRDITDESIWKAFGLRRENHPKDQMNAGRM